jgi:hypothetical protein
MPKDNSVEASEVNQTKTRELCNEVLEHRTNIHTSLGRLVSSLNIDEYEREALQYAVSSYVTNFETIYGTLANETDAEDIKYTGKQAKNLLCIADKWRFEFTKTIKIYP